MSGVSSVQILYKSSKWSEFEEIFESLKKRGYGHKNSTYFSINTKFKFRKTDELKEIFNKIQSDSQEEGVDKNIFSFNM